MPEQSVLKTGIADAYRIALLQESHQGSHLHGKRMLEILSVQVRYRHTCCHLTQFGRSATSETGQIRNQGIYRLREHYCWIQLMHRRLAGACKQREER